MKSTIRDRDVLASLRPVDVLAYLRSAGWTRHDANGDRASLWVIENADVSEDAWVPFSREVADFVIRMAETLAALERVEGRPQEEIVRDIQSTSADLIRVRTMHPQSSDGTLPFDAAVAFVEQAREMVAAAACAAVDPMPYWLRRRPKAAGEFMSKVRMGQTEKGSFVLTILNPVPPVLRDGAELESPFERRVTETLSGALQAAVDAAQKAAVTGDMGPFRAAVARGVSANLCDALAGLTQVSPDHGLEVSVTWSRSRPGSGRAMSRIPIPSDYLQIFQAASRAFKESAPVEDTLLTGLVVKLDRAPEDSSGAATISTVVDGKPRRVVLELSGTSYDEAIKAHKESIPVSCFGDLLKEGKSYRMRAPRLFVLRED